LQNAQVKYKQIKLFCDNTPFAVVSENLFYFSSAFIFTR